jgi:hypothetical protein
MSIIHGDNAVNDETVINHFDGNGLNNSIDNLEITDQKTNMRNCKKQSNNTSNVTGVQLYFDSYNNKCYLSQYSDLTGKIKRKRFSFKKYGENAYQLACEYRDLMISQIPGYTDRHGK